jgi:hypothetical protein
MSWASHTYGKATVATVNRIARADTRAFRCCPCARKATTQKMVVPEMERQVPITLGLGVSAMLDPHRRKILQGTFA